VNKKYSYGLFDVGNSAYLIVTLSFVFAPYFAKEIVGDIQLGSAYWQWTSGAVGILVALTAPFIGSYADHVANGRIKVLIVSTVLTVLINALFWFSQARDSFIVYTLLIFFLSSYFFEISNASYNSLLRDSSNKKDEIGRTSGLGYALGYIGIVPFLLFILLFIIKTDQPILNLQKENFEHIRFIAILVSFWFFIFAIPMMTFFWKGKKSKKKKYTSIKDIKKIIWNNGLTTTGKFLIARIFYADAVIVMQTGGGVYAVGVHGLTPKELIFILIVGNLVAGAFAYIGGYLNDKYNSKTIIMWSITALVLAVFAIVFSPSKEFFFFSLLLVASAIGPLQSASRTLMSRIGPKNTQGKSFGLYALSSKATAFVGPFMAGTITYYVSQQAGFASISILFLVSLFMLSKLELNDKN
jgi:UMF1 family MFS transporter|tara:strand:- start:2609 stop:3844 length:1236 start_codon:yes stop_codon:yes gene_type:complete